MNPSEDAVCEAREIIGKWSTVTNTAERIRDIAAVIERERKTHNDRKTQYEATLLATEHERDRERAARLRAETHENEMSDLLTKVTDRGIALEERAATLATALRKTHAWLERVEQVRAGRGSYFGLDHAVGENNEGCEMCAALLSAPEGT